MSRHHSFDFLSNVHHQRVHLLIVRRVDCRVRFNRRIKICQHDSHRVEGKFDGKRIIRIRRELNHLRTAACDRFRDAGVLRKVFFNQLLDNRCNRRHAQIKLFGNFLQRQFALLLQQRQHFFPIFGADRFVVDGSWRHVLGVF